MKKFVWFVLGIGAGFVLAHFVDKDPRGHELLAQADARITEFTDRIADAYREQQSRLGQAAAGLADDLVETVNVAAETTTDAVTSAKDKLTD
ncbi:ATPase [Microbacterium sp. X-17]|uniref:ATPase n=1 Tax=Microbacterium sp. X-17 TaxID=3144404 RepID=UPI0031F5BBE1